MITSFSLLSMVLFWVMVASIMPLTLAALQTVGYRELFDYFEGHDTIATAVELIKRNSRRYAKRQMTWFNRNQEIKWFNPEDEEEIVGYTNSIAK
jgi:tRNA dimethylallyltransferase